MEQEKKSATPALDEIKELMWDDIQDYSTDELRAVLIDSFTPEDLVMAQEHLIDMIAGGVVDVENDETIKEYKEILERAKKEAREYKEDIKRRLGTMIKIRGVQNVTDAITEIAVGITKIRRKKNEDEKEKE